MTNAILYFALTTAALFLFLHVVARIQIARAALVSAEERRKVAAIANRGIALGVVAVLLFAFMVARGMGGLGLIIAVALGLWLFFGCYRVTRMLILLESMMQLRKRTAKGGGMNSGALAGMVSGAAGLVALVGAFIVTQPASDPAWEEFKEAHHCRAVDSTAPTMSTQSVDAPATANKTAWLCDDGVTYYK